MVAGTFGYFERRGRLWPKCGFATARSSWKRVELPQALGCLKSGCLKSDLSIGMRDLAIAIAGLTLLTAPAAAQSHIGGPHKQTNQLGGQTVLTNPVVAPPRGSPAPLPSKAAVAARRPPLPR